MRYEIPEYRLEKLEKKLAAIEKKCKTYGCDYFYRKDDPYIKEFHANGKTYRINMVPIEIEANARINGWQYLASISHYKDGNVIKTMSPEKIPDKYKTCDGYCDHCQTQHERKYTYLVTNGNEMKQVGKACLQMYTNGLSAEMAAQIESIVDLMEAAEDMEWDLDHVPSEAILLNVNDVFCATYYNIQKYGFSSQNGDRICATLSNGFKNAVDFDYAIGKKIIDWYKGKSENDFPHCDSLNVHNYKTVADTEYIRKKDYGVAIDAVYFYVRELRRQERRRQWAEADAKRKAEEDAKNAEKAEYINIRLKSEFQGNKNDKLTIKIAKAKVVHSFESQYGTVFIYEMFDEMGNIYKWLTSSKAFGNEKENFTIVGTVKEHEEYPIADSFDRNTGKSVKEKRTVLTRCKEISPEQEKTKKKTKKTDKSNTVER